MKKSLLNISVLLSLSLAPLSHAAPQTAVFAGGCFWGVDAVFKHVRGVTEVVSGYAGGTAATARYDLVSNGDTGHAEAVEIRFDDEHVSYAQLLQVFFSVAHNPTELNRQGNDVGTQYRSAIFYLNPAQQQQAKNTLKALAKAKVFSAPIVTQLIALPAFYPAEDYHQNYLALHLSQPYIVHHDLPKLRALQRTFPNFYQ
ncbi:MAG: peptide-methionine (S)-S-oxide reductase MsrA [Gallionella sp.]